MKKLLLIVTSFIISNTAIANGLADIPPPSKQKKGADSQWIYPTNGVHSQFGCNKKNNHCIAKRHPSDPSDPLYPSQWISDWTMFRVMKNYQNNPPPYSNPPSTLKQTDYTVSYGTTYYDATYVPADGDGTGAMMEHYHKYCLPIFPIEDNNYSCSFISLGNKAYFLTYEDRPKTMLPCCMFSPLNHPPRQNFIQHLNYSRQRSLQLNHSIQAYVWQAMLDEEGPLFGYAFNKNASPDSYSKIWYRHPHSFFFSGNVPEADAPIVSQNYTSFRAEKPQAKYTWDRITKMCPATGLTKCKLFKGQ